MDCLSALVAILGVVVFNRGQLLTQYGVRTALDLQVSPPGYLCLPATIT